MLIKIYGKVCFSMTKNIKSWTIKISSH